MNVYVGFGIFGIVSGIVAAFADVPLVKPGKAEKSAGIPVNGLNPWWADVSSGRFTVSFWLSFLGQPGTYITMWLLADLIARENAALAAALRINTFIGCYIGLLCHTVYCLKPLLYQKLSRKLSDDESLSVLQTIDTITKIPTLVGFLALWLGTAVIAAIAILTGALPVSKWCLLLNPVGALLVLMPLKKCGVKIIGALGVGCALLSVLLIIAGV